MGIEYVSDPKIVRGLDYYSRTVFEYQFTGIGAQNALGGGGRYDGLIESVGGPSLSGIGFAMGINRLILAMEQTGASYPEQPKPTLYIAALGAPAMRRAAVLAQQLREQGVRAESDIVGRSLKAQMKYAGKSGFRYTDDRRQRARDRQSIPPQYGAERADRDRDRPRSRLSHLITAQSTVGAAI